MPQPACEAQLGQFQEEKSSSLAEVTGESGPWALLEKQLGPYPAEPERSFANDEHRDGTSRPGPRRPDARSAPPRHPPLGVREGALGTGQIGHERGRMLCSQHAPSYGEHPAGHRAAPSPHLKPPGGPGGRAHCGSFVGRRTVTMGGSGPESAQEPGMPTAALAGAITASVEPNIPVDSAASKGTRHHPRGTRSRPLPACSWPLLTT